VARRQRRSTLEDDDQLGLAHFVEHMAFNGTRRFKKMEIVNFLERIGMRFGPDVNAYTTFDETVYTLRIPTDDPATIETSFRILEDWASTVTFEDVEIDKERGVVVEEWRSGRGADARMRDKQFPTLFKDSRYAERLTIGKKEVLETAPHDAIRRFYRDWYRPDLMAVIAVGDFDPGQIEKTIRDHSRSLRGPKKSAPARRLPSPPHDATLRFPWPRIPRRRRPAPASTTSCPGGDAQHGRRLPADARREALPLHAQRAAGRAEAAPRPAVPRRILLLGGPSSAPRTSPSRRRSSTRRDSTGASKRS
jgi:predicted Zn-dependent peptidase